MISEFSEAAEVEEIAGPLISTTHQRLLGHSILYVFNHGEPKAKGKEIWGRARKVGGINAFLAQRDAGDDADPEFFVIEIVYGVWCRLGLSQKRALVDHELSHLTVEYDEEKDAYKLGTIGHDLEEFRGVYERHGAWAEDIREFLKAGEARQLSLIDDAKAEEFDAQFVQAVKNAEAAKAARQRIAGTVTGTGRPS